MPRPPARTGPDYWNIFRELGDVETLEEDAQEITRSLFYERAQRSSQPFFPNAAKDLFAAVMMQLFRCQRASKPRTPPCATCLINPFQRTSERSYSSMRTYARSPAISAMIAHLRRKVCGPSCSRWYARCLSGTLSVQAASRFAAVRGKGGRAVFVEYDLGMGNVLYPNLPPVDRSCHQRSVVS